METLASVDFTESRQWSHERFPTAISSYVKAAGVENFQRIL
jgi:hypothetical protein